MMDLMSASAGEELFLREFSVNACEAIRDTRRDHGTVLWDVDERQLQASGRALLCVIDDGIGMSAEELVAYIGNLSSSGKDHRVGANHGVGAEIAGARFSPRGMEFRSWHQGIGSMVVLYQHPGGVWGLKELCPEAAGEESYVVAIGDEQRPPLLSVPEARDGTQVTFLGREENDDTYAAPGSVSEGRSMWVRRFLNDRLYELPCGVTMLVREGVAAAPPDADPDASSLTGEYQEVLGARTLLAQYSEQCGSVKLGDARCHWWILRESSPSRARRPVACEWAATGFCGLLHGGEILERAAGLAGAQRLSGTFKIRLGSQRVVLLIEPDDPGKVTQDVARMSVRLNGQALPWECWGAQFAARMAPEIVELQRSLMDRLGGGPREQVVTARWRRVCKPIVARLQITRPPQPREPAGSTARRARREDHALVNSPGSPHATSAKAAHDAPDLAAGSGDIGKDGLAGSAKVQARVREVTLAYPTTLWLTAGAAPPDLHNEAARYDAGEDVLTVNPDFPVYRALLEEQLEQHSPDPEAAAIITEKLRQWWELALVECIDIAKRLSACREELDKRTSVHALTAAMSPLSPIAQHLRREVPQQLGRHGRARADGAQDA